MARRRGSNKLALRLWHTARIRLAQTERPSMEKISLSRAWEETSAVLARDGRLFVAVALALFVLPGLILSVSMPVTPPNELPVAGPWIAVAVVAALVWIVGQLAVVRLSMEPHVAVGEAIGHGMRRMPYYVAAMICWALPVLVIGSLLSAYLAKNETHPSIAAALALIALTVAGAYLGIRFMLSSAVASAETVGPVMILRRSWDLSHGNWWRLFAFLLLFFIGAFCLLLAVEAVAGLIVRIFAADAGPRSLGGFLVILAGQLVSALLSVGFFVMLARIYVQRSGAAVSQPSVPSSGT